MKVLRSMGINWDMFYSYCELENGAVEVKPLNRYHKYDKERSMPDNFEIVGEVRMACNDNKRSGVNLNKFKETGVSEHYKNDHLLLEDGRLLKLTE